jgi:hypothetical protein
MLQESTKQNISNRYLFFWEHGKLGTSYDEAEKILLELEKKKLEIPPETAESGSGQLNTDMC